MMKRKLSFLMMLFLVVLSSNIVVGAKEKDDKELLYQAGFSKDIVATMEQNFMSEIIDEVNENPQNVDVTTDTTTLDMLDELDLAVNLSKKELVEKCNISMKDANKIKESIEDMQKMSDAEMKEKYNLSSADLIVIKDALTPDKDYVEQKESDLILSSTIGTSKLTFTQSVVNKSTSKKPIYKVNLSYNWKKCYYPWGFDDKIACAWGGKLVYNSNKSLTRVGNYYNMNGIIGAFSWGSYKGNKSLSCSTAQKNMTFVAPQSYSGSLSNISYLKSGNISFTIDNSKFVNSKTNICSVYCHRTLQVGFGNIDFSGASISVGGAYDTTDMANTTTTVNQ